jgi:hypothetical protein
MRMNMDIQQDTMKISMFKSKTVHRIIAKFEASEEEKEAIRTLGLENEIIYSWPNLDEKGAKYMGDTCRMGAGTLLQSGVWGPNSNLVFESLINAKSAMQGIEEGFRRLKKLLVAAELPNSTTIEI